MEEMTCDGQKCPCGADAVKEMNGMCMCEACASGMSGDMPAEEVTPDMPAEGSDMPMEESEEE